MVDVDATALFSVDVDHPALFHLVEVEHCLFLLVDVNHPALFYLVDGRCWSMLVNAVDAGRRPFYSPFHQAPESA